MKVWVWKKLDGKAKASSFLWVRRENKGGYVITNFSIDVDSSDFDMFFDPLRYKYTIPSRCHSFFQMQLVTGHSYMNHAHLMPNTYSLFVHIILNIYISMFYDLKILRKSYSFFLSLLWPRSLSKTAKIWTTSSMVSIDLLLFRSTKISQCNFLFGKWWSEYIIFFCLGLFKKSRENKLKTMNRIQCH